MQSPRSGALLVPRSGFGYLWHPRAQLLSGMRPVIGVTSQVTRSWPADHACDGSPDSGSGDRRFESFLASQTTTCWGIDEGRPQQVVSAPVGHRGCLDRSAVSENQAHSFLSVKRSFVRLTPFCDKCFQDRGVAVSSRGATRPVDSASSGSVLVAQPVIEASARSWRARTRTDPRPLPGWRFPGAGRSIRPCKRAIRPCHPRRTAVLSQ
jgi:hypothetical protein